MIWYIVYYISIFLILLSSILIILWHEKFSTSGIACLPSTRLPVESTVYPSAPPPPYKKFAPPDYDEAMSQQQQQQITIFCVSDEYEKSLQGINGSSATTSSCCSNDTWQVRVSTDIYPIYNFSFSICNFYYIHCYTLTCTYLISTYRVALFAECCCCCCKRIKPYLAIGMSSVYTTTS